MSMVSVIGDNWTGPRSGEWQVVEPDATTVQGAIRALDGVAMTSLTLAFGEPYRQLTVAGGPTYFVVSGELDDDTIIDLINPDADPGAAPVELVAGGNRAIFAASQVVGIEQAAAAAEAFLKGFPSGLGAEWRVE